MLQIIAFEGIDGSGKTTLAQSTGLPYVQEPRRGGPIRNLVLSGGWAPHAEVLLFQADRAQNLHLWRDKGLVACDRYKLSTLAYQVHGRGADREWVQNVMSFAPEPVLTFLLDIPVEVAYRRRLARGGSMDTFEAQGQGFFERVRQGYLEEATVCDHEVVVLDATKPIEVLIQEVRDVLYDAARNFVFGPCAVATGDL